MSVLSSWYFSDFFSHVLGLLTQFMNQLKIQDTTAVEWCPTELCFKKSFILYIKPVYLIWFLVEAYELN